MTKSDQCPEGQERFSGRVRKVPDKDYMENGLIKHNLPAPRGLLHCKSVLEVGPGIRPYNWYKPESYMAYEPYDVYCERMSSAGYRCLNLGGDALVQLDDASVDQIISLDVLEHMSRYDGQEFLRHAIRVASHQVVIYTPLGFMEQHGDAWGLGGDEWQEHRSGWVPEDLPGWDCYAYGKGFYALFTK